MHTLRFCAVALIFSAMNAHADNQTSAVTGCAAKKADVKMQLEKAQAHGNQAQEAKLKIVQKQLGSNCTDDGLRREREANVKKKENKLAERQAELKKAKAKGKPEKIAQQEKKLQDAEAELKEARDELSK